MIVLRFTCAVLNERATLLLLAIDADARFGGRPEDFLWNDRSPVRFACVQEVGLGLPQNIFSISSTGGHRKKKKKQECETHLFF